MIRRVMINLADSTLMFLTSPLLPYEHHQIRLPGARYTRHLDYTVSYRIGLRARLPMPRPTLRRVCQYERK